MKRYKIIILVLFHAALLILFIKGYGPSYTQPISYNHMLHIELGLECSYCHRYVMEQTFASIPAVEVCLECHEEALTDSREEEKIREFAKDGSEIPWIQVCEVPDHVFFSHRRHVSVAEIACKQCHGDVESRTEPLTRPLVDLSMDFCLDCHASSGASVDCVACHY
jgi:predicted CXXCH cytochrome family protein